MSVLRGGSEDLDKEGAEGQLEGSDGTVGIGEGGLQMSEHMGRGSVSRGPMGRRAAAQESRADHALAEVKPFPDAQQGPVAQLAVAGAEGGANAVGDGVLEKAPQAGGCQAETSDFVGGPDAEGAAAAGPSLAVAAKDPPGAEGFTVGVAVVKTVQKAMANESADSLAVRTGGQLEVFGNGLPFLGVAVKPALLAHVASSAKIVIVRERGGAG